jgi:Formate hydrogenlyase subunit 6/NADH:ubiquinone oxidoreductase 23 kD subunit (chain I)
MSKLYGKGISDSLSLVFRHFIDSYWVDLRDRLGRKSGTQQVAFRSSDRARGLFTVEYPEVQLPVPEEFRVLPYLVHEQSENGEIKQRCTACGTCARVCPPQCIWIERAKDPATGKPQATPAGFWIDIDVCMNCGLCVEVCPFDAIQMDHDIELSSTTRKDHLWNLQKLSKPAEYYQRLSPAKFSREQAAREAKGQ